VRGSVRVAEAVARPESSKSDNRHPGKARPAHHLFRFSTQATFAACLQPSRSGKRRFYSAMSSNHFSGLALVNLVDS
jgi:hypothetical protein